MLRPFLLLLMLAACGDDDRGPVRLDLAPRYQGAGVVRRDQLGAAPELEFFRLTLSELTLAGGRVRGFAVAEGGEHPLALDGPYDPASGQARFEGGTAGLTTPQIELVVRFGFRLEEGGPPAGVASELVGFIATATTTGTTDGRWIAIEDRPDPLPVPIPDLIRVTPSARVGRVIVEGEPGASVGGAGIQILRFSPEREVPEVQSVAVRFSGEFVLEIAGRTGDLLLVRALSGGRMSDAAPVPVP